MLTLLGSIPIYNTPLLISRSIRLIALFPVPSMAPTVLGLACLQISQSPSLLRGYFVMGIKMVPAKKNACFVFPFSKYFE